MATQKGGKSGALDAFWDTVTGPSTTSGSMSDLLGSLPGSPAIKKAPQKKGPPQPPQAKEPTEDTILILVKALLPSGPAGLTVPEIVKQTKLGPTETFNAIRQATDLGLILENNQNPEKKSFRLTEAGSEFAQEAQA